VAIITGASRGIGAVSARAFAAAGAAVVLAARDAAALRALADQITAAGGQALAVPTDVSEPGEVERMVAETLRAFGKLDCAFNNAAGGRAMPAPLASLAVEDFDSVVRVSLRGVFLCMKYEIPALIASGGGAIVNMSSTAGLRGVRGIAAYVASKHGVIGLTKTAALDYAPQGIRVNAVAPGPIKTVRIPPLTDEQHAMIARAVPLGRSGEPEEVAATAIWLCSNQASYITGATFPIDGGKLAAGA
jgi:NAD(P)-dependent dehydrogenase (short-subunit alcohol dehydrogenase family)